MNGFLSPARIITVLILFLSHGALAGEVRLPAGSPSLRYAGRIKHGDAGHAYLIWSGSSVTVAFKGTGCKAVLASPGSGYRILVDGREQGVLMPAGSADTLHVLAQGLTDAEHSVTLFKRTEVSVGIGVFRGFIVEGVVLPPPPAPVRRIEFIGNSITCGYGALDSLKEHAFKSATEDHWVTYAALSARAFGAEHHAICWSGKGLFRNNTGDTLKTMPKLWELTDPTFPGDYWNFAWKPDVVVIDLGTNDFFLAPPPDSAAFVDTYVRFLAAIRGKYPKVPVVLLDGPMLSDYFPSDAAGKPVPSLSLNRKYLRAIAAKAESAQASPTTTLSLTPNSASVGYGADWHPNQKQHLLNARELVAHLSKQMGWTEVVRIGNPRTGKTGKDSGPPWRIRKGLVEPGEGKLGNGSLAGRDALDLAGRARERPLFREPGNGVASPRQGNTRQRR